MSQNIFLTKMDSFMITHNILKKYMNEVILNLNHYAHFTQFVVKFLSNGQYVSVII